MTAAMYPVMLDLRERLVVVIGGGKVAEQKVKELVESGATITVISRSLSPALEMLVRTGRVHVCRREYVAGDLNGARLAIAASEGPDARDTNRAVWREAEARGVLLNAVDDVEHCHFIAPSVHREGDITVAVSTSGRCPTLAVRLRERIAQLVRPEHAMLARIAGELRASIARRVPTFAARRRLWYDIVDSPAIEHLRRGEEDEARRVIEELVVDAEREPRHADGHGGTVYLVGAGPGDPGLITARGLELLRSADVVVHDRLVDAALLANARHDARLIPVGKEGYARSTPQESIHAVLIREAGRGRTVVRLKGGDPFVFGRGAEEILALRDAGVAVHVVPGVSSAIAVPASAGIPVTHRSLASAFAVVTGHDVEGDGAPSSIDWAALAGMPTLVVLMGLRALPNIIARLQAYGRARTTPIAVIGSGTLRGERCVVGTLETIVAEVTANPVESPATIVVGDVVALRGMMSRAAMTRARRVLSAS